MTTIRNTALAVTALFLMVAVLVIILYLPQRSARLRFVRIMLTRSRMKLRKELKPTHPVCRRVMQFDEQTGAFVGEAFDQYRLPGRASTVERRHRDLLGRLENFTPTPTLGHPDAPYVIMQVEIGIVHPTGNPQSEGRFHHLLSETRCHS